MEPLWLQVAGDAGSALGGLTVFGALIGYGLRQRRTRIDNRHTFAQPLHPIALGLNQLSNATHTSAVELQRQIRKVAYDTPGRLDGHAHDAATRRLAAHLQDVLDTLSFGIRVADNPDYWPVAKEHLGKVSWYFLMTHDLLTTRRSFFARRKAEAGIKKLAPPADESVAMEAVVKAVLGYSIGETPPDEQATQDSKKPDPPK